MGRSLVVLVVSSMSLSGCFVATLQRQAAVRHAAEVPYAGRPLEGPFSALATDHTRYTLIGLSATEMCVAVDAKVDPGTMLETRFELRGLKDPDQAMKDAPVSENPTVKILASDSERVPYLTSVTDSIKDADGTTLATASHTEQAYATTYLTEMEICFHRPPLEDTRYLVVRPVVAPVVFSFGMPTGLWAPRPGWFELPDDGAAVSMD